MNPNEPRHDPTERDPEPVVDPLDQRVSAELDGHAPAPGSKPLDAPALERQRALAAARDLLAVPPPALDDVTRRRLLRNALDAAPRSSMPTVTRPWRWTGSGAAVAAALLVVLLAGWGLVRLDHGSSSKGSGNRAASSETVQAAPLDLHDVSKPDVLRRLVETALAAQKRSAAATTATTVVNPRQATNPGAASPSPSCMSTVRVPAGDRPELLAHATFHGAPALVIVAREQSRTLIFVLASGDCRLLSSQFLRQ